MACGALGQRLFWGYAWLPKPCGYVVRWTRTGWSEPLLHEGRNQRHYTDQDEGGEETHA